LKLKNTNIKINTEDKILKKFSFKNFFNINEKSNEVKNTSAVKNKSTLITDKSTSDLTAVNHDPGINKLIIEVAKRFLLKQFFSIIVE